MTLTTLRPGYLVALHTALEGGVKYDRVDIADRKDGEEAIAKWETTRTIYNAEEYERANKTRGACGSKIRSVCAKTPFGLLCSVAKEPDLDQAIAEAQAMAKAFNSTATYSKISVWIMKGRIADNDQEAAKAVGAEVRRLLDEMTGAIDNLDVDSVRDAANRARQLGMVLAPTDNAKLTDAIKQARRAATEIVARVQKKGEQASVVLAEMDRSAISLARMAFIDLDDAKAVEPLPPMSIQRFAGLDTGDGELNDETDPNTAASNIRPNQDPETEPKPAPAPSMPALLPVPAIDMDTAAQPSAANGSAPYRTDFDTGVVIDLDGLPLSVDVDGRRINV